MTLEEIPYKKSIISSKLVSLQMKIKYLQMQNGSMQYK